MYSIIKSINMKKKYYIIFCLFFVGIVSAQNLNYEAEVLEQYLQQNKKKSSVSDISGICDAVTINKEQGIIAGWDGCGGTVYEGTVEFELTTEFLYVIMEIDLMTNLLEHIILVMVVTLKAQCLILMLIFQLYTLK